MAKMKKIKPAKAVVQPVAPVAAPAPEPVAYKKGGAVKSGGGYGATTSHTDAMYAMGGKVCAPKKYAGGGRVNRYGTEPRAAKQPKVVAPIAPAGLAASPAMPAPAPAAKAPIIQPALQARPVPPQRGLPMPRRFR